jgi:hypothetical protein
MTAKRPIWSRRKKTQKPSEAGNRHRTAICLLMFVAIGEQTTFISSPKRSTSYPKSSKMAQAEYTI